MRLHYVLNHGGTPESKLADVEIHFEEGLLAGMKLIGCSVWRTQKGEAPTVLLPSRSYATAGGIRYYELLRGALVDDSPEHSANVDVNKSELRKFKEFVKYEYLKLTDSTAASNG
ncbi:MAG TPA: hypothetical protein VGK27_06770 [Candidatus Deferrimicrobiaceae bacterium]|jgi:hypothetical protein